MLALLLAVRAVGPPAPAVPPRAAPSRDTVADSTYSTPALRALVLRAAARNAVVPRGLDAYHVTIESELAILIRQPDGTEGATQIEQVESVARWHRPGAFTQRVVGYRSRFAGLNLSALNLIKQAWAVPILYGNRLGLFLGRDTTHAARRALARDTAIRVYHPFAPDREAIYRFSGGDTALTIHVPDRTIPVVIVHVQPRTHLSRRTVVFRGDIYLDVQRAEIVRMRGAFETVGGTVALGARLQELAVQGVAFIDLTNREVAGRYWLPATQRIEGEAGSSFTGETRSVFRVISHFGDYALNDSTELIGPGLDTAGAPTAPTTPTTPTAPTAPLATPVPRLPSVAGADSTARDTTLPTDTLRSLPHTLTFAPSDSVSGFSTWRAPIGDATTAVRVDDFVDVSPDRWRPGGPPIVEPGTERISDFLHVDRIEGLFTGLGAVLRLRDAAPGVTAQAHLGWAWREGTARGGLLVERQRGTWTLAVRAARALDNTNDFRTTFSSGPFLESLITQDDYDYVDRRSATASVLHQWLARDGGPPVVVARAEAGVADDRGDRTRVAHGFVLRRLFMGDSLFRPNRNVLPGTYARGALTLDFHPGIDAGFVRQGVGARLRTEVGGGAIAWQRTELRLVANRTWGRFTAVGRADAGIVTGTVIPPQQMFEIGSTEGLLAYNYKQFGGDRAIVWRGEGLYALPFWDSPLRIAGLILPSPSPALAAGFQSGWADASTAAGRRALVALGSRVDPATNIVLRDSTGTPIPASRPTTRVRTSLNLILRFFGGAAGVGVARALDQGARWQAIFRLGAAL